VEASLKTYISIQSELFQHQPLTKSRTKDSRLKGRASPLSVVPQKGSTPKDRVVDIRLHLGVGMKTSIPVW